MSVFRPFRALRPAKGCAADLLCPPYDVVSKEDAARICEKNATSFMNVIRADARMMDIDEYDPAVYKASADYLRKLEDEGVMVEDAVPSFYIYAQTMNGRTQTGIVGCASIDDYLDGTVKRHEVTRKEKEEDRVRHFDACDADTEPVFLMYRDEPRLAEIVKGVTSAPAEYEATSTQDGIDVVHRLWCVADMALIDEIRAIFTKIPALYIADGHHRTASAVRVGCDRRKENAGYDGTEEFNYFMAVAFPESELCVLDYNRLVRDLNAHAPDEFLEKLTGAFEIAHTDVTKPAEKHSFTMYLGGSWYELRLKKKLMPSDSASPVDALDVSILQERVLGPVLGIKDPRTDARISFCGGIKGTECLAKAVDAGEYKVAFAIYPVSVAEIMAIADAKLVMPPKSTWFEPKLGSGWFVHKF